MNLSNALILRYPDWCPCWRSQRRCCSCWRIFSRRSSTRVYFSASPRKVWMGRVATKAETTKKLSHRDVGAGLLRWLLCCCLGRKTLPALYFVCFPRHQKLLINIWIFSILCRLSHSSFPVIFFFICLHSTNTCETLYDKSNGDYWNKT